MRYALIAACIFMLGGCAAVHAPSPGDSKSEKVLERNYKVGVQQTTSVGDDVVRVRDYWIRKTEATALQANSDLLIKGALSTGRIAKNQVFPIDGTRNRDGVAYYVVHMQMLQLGMPYLLGLQVAPNGEISRDVLGEFNTTTVYKILIQPETGRLMPVRRQDVEAAFPYSNYEIVFNGSDRDSLKFTYREFSPEDLARTAFYQDLSYPISSKTIRFRKIVIDIVNVDAQEISYIVRSDS